jgi:hypothetical protein
MRAAQVEQGKPASAATSPHRPQNLADPGSTEPQPVHARCEGPSWGFPQWRQYAASNDTLSPQAAHRVAGAV